MDNIQRLEQQAVCCEDCDIKGYCDKNPNDCPIAKRNKQIAEYEEAKAELKKEIEKPFIKFLDWFENKLNRLEKWWHNG